MGKISVHYLCAAASVYEMACYHPITAYRSNRGRDPVTKKWPLVFKRNQGFTDLEVKIPCGQCIGCRLERSRQWAVRCVHESKLYPNNNCFLTLTYNDENLPRGINTETGELDAGEPSLNKRDIVLFLKRLRKKYGDGIRFFQCGEYGEQLRRPHHHVLLFNHVFPDKKYWKTKKGVHLYLSDTLNKLWGLGHCVIGDVNFESAAYVARYVTKKITGDPQRVLDHYGGILPEYITMSRKPGIARNFFEEFQSDIYPSDQCVLRPGLIARPPKYYDNIYDLTNPESFAKIKKARRVHAITSADNTPERLKDRELCQLLKAQKLYRKYESGEC